MRLLRSMECSRRVLAAAAVLLAIASQAAEASVSMAEYAAGNSRRTHCGASPRRRESCSQEHSDDHRSRLRHPSSTDTSRPAIASWAQKKQQQDAFVGRLLEEVSDRSDAYRSEVRDCFAKIRQELLEDAYDDVDDEAYEYDLEPSEEREIHDSTIDNSVSVQDDVCAATEAIREDVTFEEEVLEYSPSLQSFEDCEQLGREEVNFHSAAEQVEEYLDLDEQATSETAVESDAPAMEATLPTLEAPAVPAFSFSAISVDRNTPHEWLELGSVMSKETHDAGEAHEHEDTMVAFVGVEWAKVDSMAFTLDDISVAHEPAHVIDDDLTDEEAEMMLRGGHSHTVESDSEDLEEAPDTAKPSFWSGDDSRPTKPSFWTIDKQLKARRSSAEAMLARRGKRMRRLMSNEDDQFEVSARATTSKDYAATELFARSSRSQALILGVSGGSLQTDGLVREAIVKGCMFTLFGVLFTLAVQLLSRFT